MDHLFTWSGTYFGYRDGDSLWTHDGRHVARFDGDEVYGRHGRYLGEVVNDHLATSRSKTSWRRPGFSPYASRVGQVPFVNQVGFVMLATKFHNLPGNC